MLVWNHCHCHYHCCYCYSYYCYWYRGCYCDCFLYTLYIIDHWCPGSALSIPFCRFRSIDSALLVALCRYVDSAPSIPLDRFRSTGSALPMFYIESALSIRYIVIANVIVIVSVIVTVIVVSVVIAIVAIVTAIIIIIVSTAIAINTCICIVIVKPDSFPRDNIQQMFNWIIEQHKSTNNKHQLINNRTIENACDYPTNMRKH